MKILSIAVAAIMMVVAGRVDARVTSIRIDRVEPFADGTRFGATGAYERAIGVARGELDPANRLNVGIAGLDMAKRNAAGKVEYETDLYILRPVDAAKGNHHLLWDVLNRGNKVIANRLNTTTPRDDSNDPATLAQAGDGFLFRRGYTMAWAGWDPDAPRTNNGMTLRAPALPDVVRDIEDEFVSGTRGAPRTRFTLSYESASQDNARLTVRTQAGDRPVEIPFRFVDSRTIELLPEGTRPEPGAIHSFAYRAKSPWVGGIGFAAQRDVAAFLKSNAPDAAGKPNPAGGKITASIAFGVSQSGRFLRDFIKFGFNRDESDRKVFDGVLSHVAGIGGVFLNDLFAQPFRTRTQHEDHAMPENAFPYSAARTHDPTRRREAALLPGTRFDPLLIETNTDAEYWQKGASLLGTDPTGRRDVPLPATTRLFLIAGTQHAGRHGASDAPGPCANLRNPHDPYPALRALLVALDDWIVTGRAAPESRLPKIAGGTLVAAEQLNFPVLPRFVAAKAPNRVDSAVALVPAVDRDGNPRAGLMLPDIAHPLATHTGFNLYKAPFPEGELCDRDGSILPFAVTDAAKAANDPRASLTERYGSAERYAALVKATADRLVRDRLLLREDADRYVARAKTAF
jgi:hypothetical protein